jgi:pimeloyl-ACP methyl ester carboxylesterase
VLARAGFGVLLYDARGHGHSGGDGMEFGWYGDDDVYGAVSFVQSRSDVSPGRIALVGLSMGAEEAIGAAAADDRIGAVVGEGATGRTAGDREWLSEAYGVRGWLQEQLDRLTFATAALLTSADRPPTLRGSVAQASPRPMLLIAAGRVPEENEVARRLQQVSPASVSVWVVPGSGHCEALPTRPHEWTTRVVSFLATALAQR